MLNNLIEKYKLNREQSKLINDWIDLMATLGVYNNKLEIYTLKNIIKVSDGFQCRILVPFGLLKDKLNEIKPYIEESFNCTFECKKIDKSHYVNAQFKF